MHSYRVISSLDSSLAKLTRHLHSAIITKGYCTCSAPCRHITAQLSPELDMGQVHPSTGWVGTGPFVWVCVGHPGW